MSERMDYGKPGDPSGCYFPREWRTTKTAPARLRRMNPRKPTMTDLIKRLEEADAIADDQGASPVVSVGVGEQRQRVAAMIAKPGLFSTDNQTAHRAASPYAVNVMRAEALAMADAILALIQTERAG